MPVGTGVSFVVPCTIVSTRDLGASRPGCRLGALGLGGMLNSLTPSASVGVVRAVDMVSRG